MRGFSSWVLVGVVLAAFGCAGEKPPEETVPVASGFTFDTWFGKRVDVFGIPVHASVEASDEHVLHAAGVLAQYLDNDQDGEPDDPFLVETMLVQGARLFMGTDRDDLDRRFEAIEREQPGSLARAAWWVNPGGITPDDWSWQDLQSEEVVLVDERGGSRFDGALEEVLHLVSHVGLASAYPSAFAEAPGSRLGDAMDKMRGGQFPGVPEQYPDGALYTYDDETCVYQCQATEYIYWALTSLLGGQVAAERLAEIENEWRLNTAEKLSEGDPDVFALLTDPAYNLATTLPDGVYLGGPLELVTIPAAGSEDKEHQ